MRSTLRRDFLDFAPPDIGEEEIAEVVECLRSGWLTSGSRVAALEERFAEFVGADAALAVNSGTAALLTALIVSGVGRGDPVVVPVMTFAAAAHEVEHVGARPIFVDSEPETLNVDPAAVAKAVSENTIRCIVPVHLHGHPCDMTALLDVARARGASIVEDAAHALPAKLNGVRVGSTRPAVMTTFSFYATKNMTTGEGGMVTGPADAVDEARKWILHGITRGTAERERSGARWTYDVDRPGFKHNMSDIQAALGLVQLRRLPTMHARRKEIAGRYAEALREVEEVELPLEQPNVEHSWHIYSIRLRLDQLAIDRGRFIDELTDRGIGTGVHFIPLNLMSYYRDAYDLRPEDFPVATREFERLVSLPIHSRMSDDDADNVVAAITDVIGRHKR